MSNQTSKKNSFRETSINRTKPSFVIHKFDTQNARSFKKLPLIKQRKYSSSKNLIVSGTCEVHPFAEQTKSTYLFKLRKKFNKRTMEKFLNTQSGVQDGKYFFQKREERTLQFDPGQLKKYSSCNKLSSFPSIPQIHIPNDQSYVINQNNDLQREIKSSNSIKLQNIQYLKKPKFERIPLKKILKSNMSKTINPRKIDSENSIEIQNEQKNLIVKKRSKLSKDHIDHFDSKTKILVKNPFHKIPKKQSSSGDKILGQSLENLEQQFRLSKIFEDTHDLSEISINGKSDIEDLISFMNY